MRGRKVCKAGFPPFLNTPAWLPPSLPICNMIPSLDACFIDYTIIILYIHTKYQACYFYVPISFHWSILFFSFVEPYTLQTVHDWWGPFRLFQLHKNVIRFYLAAVMLLCMICTSERLRRETSYSTGILILTSLSYWDHSVI